MRVLGYRRLRLHRGRQLFVTLINDTDHEVINGDKMTYAATEGSVADPTRALLHLKIDTRWGLRGSVPRSQSSP